MSINKPVFKSRDIICPECGENALITIDNYKIKIFGCRNRHETDNILLNQFYDYKVKGFSKRICIDGNEKIKTNQKLYRCLNCNIFLCEKCSSMHDNHYSICYDQFLNYCTYHYNKKNNSYCKTCRRNICSECQILHNNNSHEIIELKSLYKDKDYLKKLLNNMENKKNELNHIIKNMPETQSQDILNNVSNNIEIFYTIHDEILKNYIRNPNNYEAIINLNEIIKNYEMKDIIPLLKEKNIENQFNMIYDLYMKMNEIDKDSTSLLQVSQNFIKTSNNQNNFYSNNKGETTISFCSTSNRIKDDCSKNNYNQQYSDINSYTYETSENNYNTNTFLDNSLYTILNNDINDIMDDTNNNSNSYVENKKENIYSVNKYDQRENSRKKELTNKMKIDIHYYSRNKPKGLCNLGLNSYINSLLQCLFYIPELRNYFIDNIQYFSDEQPVCKAFAKVMWGLKYSSEENCKAKDFMEIMGKKNSLFLGKKTGDAKDLFFNLIDLLSDELKIQNDDEISIENNVNITDKRLMYEEAKKETDKNIINDLFIGYYEIKYQCSKYLNIYSFSSESFILFNLEKIFYHYHKNVFTIEECFAYNFKRNYKTDFFCGRYNKIENDNAEEIIYEPPKILVLILDSRHGKQFIGMVDFKKDLDIRNYMDSENNQCNTKYKLIGVCTHSDTSSSSDHYTARCLSDNNKYYYFSDTNVREIDEEDLYEDEPYLLFYKRKDIDN